LQRVNQLADSPSVVSMYSNEGTTMIRLRAFTNPLYGSDTQIPIDPASVVEVEDRMRGLFPYANILQHTLS
jgi:hypothetical protein